MKAGRFVVAVFLMLGMASAQTQAAFPNTVPGKLMAQWLKLVNAGDPAAVTQFVAQHYAKENLGPRKPEDVAQGQLHLVAMMHGLKLAKVEKSSETSLRVILSGNTIFPSLLQGMYQVDPAHQKILRSMYMPANADALGVAKLAPSALTTDLAGKLQQATQAGEFSGAVLVAKNGKPLFQQAFGYADRDKKIANTLNTRFRIGSMSKMFTAVAIAQLVQAGKLKYTDTIADVLPDYPNQAIAKKITVAELLTHTSGLGDIFNDQFEKKKDSLQTLHDYLQLFANEPLRFEPGKGWDYSNAGYIVLGLMVEKVSGQSYYDYVQQHIFKPAGMNSTGNTPKNVSSPTLAVGYMHAPGGKLSNNYDTLPWRSSSAGGAESTVGDLLRFAEALRTYKLLKKDATEEITSGKVSPFPPDRMNQYGYGFEDDRDGGRRTVGHGGGAPGMNGYLQIYWDEGYVVAALSNLDPPAAENVANYIRARLQ